MLDSDHLSGIHERVVPNQTAGTFKSRRSGTSQHLFYSYTLSAMRIKRLTEDLLAMLVGQGKAELAHRYRLILIFEEWRSNATPVSDAPTTVPDFKPRDIIVDSAGTEWTVDMIPEHKLMNEAWNLLVYKSIGQ